MDDTPAPVNAPKPNPVPFLDQWRAIRDQARESLAGGASGSPVSGGSGAEPTAVPHPEASPSSEAVPPPPTTSLDTTETSVGDPIAAFLAEKPTDPLEKLCLEVWEKNVAVRFRHSGWWDIRKKIFSSLKRTGQTSSRLSSFASCGGSSWVQVTKEDPSRLRLSCNHCHDRLCTPCANPRSFRLT